VLGYFVVELESFWDERVLAVEVSRRHTRIRSNKHIQMVRPRPLMAVALVFGFLILV